LLRVLRLTLIAVAIAAICDSAGAAAPGPAKPENPALRDARLVAKARRALQDDSVLSALNLGVSVKAGVASLWGTVPTPNLRHKAEDIVRKVPGILDVKNELGVEAADEPLTEFLRIHRPTGQEVATDWGRPPAWLTRRWTDVETTSNPPAPPTVALMAPLGISALPDAPGNLALAIERVRQSDGRFLNVRAELQGGVVRLRGTVTRGEDLMALAQAISRLPGVERVVVIDVRTTGEH
jgi:hyperosmotically inducible periplasmic protein